MGPTLFHMRNPYPPVLLTLLACLVLTQAWPLFHPVEPYRYLVGPVSGQQRLLRIDTRTGEPRYLW
jgi:hypothetical protein